MSWSVLQMNWFATFQMKVTVRANSRDQNITVSTIYSELLIMLQMNLAWWYMIISRSIKKEKNVSLCKKDQGSSNSSKFQECLSGWYVLNSWTFCNQTWYICTLSLTGVSREKIIVPVFNVEGSCNQNMTVFCMLWAAGHTATKLYLKGARIVCW